MSEEYIYYRVPIRKGSIAELHLIRDARRLGYRYPATLIGRLIEDRYEQLALLPEPKTTNEIWFPDTLSGAAIEVQVPSREEPQSESPWREQHIDDPRTFPNKIDSFIEED